MEARHPRVTQGRCCSFPCSGGELSTFVLRPPQVVDIIRVNVDKVLERDQKLSELDDRADALQAGASQFESSAAKLKRKYWWKNCKVNVLVLSLFFSLASMHRRQEKPWVPYSVPLTTQDLRSVRLLGENMERPS